MKTKRITIGITAVACLLAFSTLGYAEQQSRVVLKTKQSIRTKNSGSHISATPISIPRTFDGKNPHLVFKQIKSPALDPGLGP